MSDAARDELMLLRAMDPLYMSETAKELLEWLVEAGDLSWSKLTAGLRRGFKFELLLDGYAFRKGNNGHGAVTVTKRGILKALSIGIIKKHPLEQDSCMDRLARNQRADQLAKLYGLPR